MPLKIAVHKGAKNINFIRKLLMSPKSIFLVFAAVNDFCQLFLNSDVTLTPYDGTLISLINVEARLLILRKKSTLHAHFHTPRLLIS